MSGTEYGGGESLLSSLDEVQRRTLDEVARAYGVPAFMFRPGHPSSDPYADLDLAAPSLSLPDALEGVRAAYGAIGKPHMSVSLYRGPSDVDLFAEHERRGTWSSAEILFREDFPVRTSRHYSLEQEAILESLPSASWFWHGWRLRDLAISTGLGSIGAAVRAGGVLLFERGDKAVVVMRPAIRTENNRPHCASGPAVTWMDGSERWYWHGIPVPQAVIEQPETITLAQIDAEPNIELQRVMIERFGWDRFAAEARAEIVDHDERWGTLYRRGGADWSRQPVVSVGGVAVAWVEAGTPPILYVKVVNRSPEPDGSFRQYVLPVHPELRPLPDAEQGETRFGQPQALTALNAVASTFGMRGEEYAARLRTES